LQTRRANSGADKRTEREQSESRKRKKGRGRKTEQNCSAPDAFGISIMSKTLARWEGRERTLMARRDSRREWKLFREISPGGHALNFEYIIRHYLPWLVVHRCSVGSPCNSSGQRSRRISRIVTNPGMVFR